MSQAAVAMDASPAPVPALQTMPAEPQREGDATAGYRALVGENYVGCGVPRSLVERFFGSVSPAFLLPNRPEGSAGLPYFLNGYETSDGTEMATASCLGCHASMLQGALVIGLGDSRLDFSMDTGTPLAVASLLPMAGEAKDEFQKLVQRVRTIAPFIRTKVAGSNPGDAIAAALFAHRDPKTLAWSDSPLLAEPTHEVAPVDVPPWWHLKKKNALFYTGAGRGDQARIMMTTSALCTDSVERAQAIDRYFPDLRAFVLSIEAPAYPFPIDEQLAATGESLFAKRCQRCHGSYGEAPSYPNLLVSSAEVGTDPALAVGGGQFAAPYIKWFAESFYGEIARLEPGQGYVAPPLDGIWATAPYLHNGSLPTVAAVLDSKSRPARWMDLGSRSSYEQDLLGFLFLAAEEGAPGNSRVYDTSRYGHSNSGHTYGDSLSETQRQALLEYLKTL